MANIKQHESWVRLRGILTAFDWIFMSAITVVALTTGLSGTRWPAVGLLRTVSFTVTDTMFVAGLVLLWNWLFRMLHARHDDLLDQAVTLFLIVGRCLGLTMLAALYMGIVYGRGHIAGAALLMLVSSLSYETVRIVAVGAVKTALIARNPEIVVILGSGHEAANAWRRIRTRYFATIQLLGFVDDRPWVDLSPEIASRYLGDLDNLRELTHSHKLTRLVVAVADPNQSEVARDAIRIAQSEGVEVSSLNEFLLMYG